MDYLRLQSAFKFVAILSFGDGGQLMTAANLCPEAVVYYKFQRKTALRLNISELPVHRLASLILMTKYEVQNFLNK